LLRIIAPSGSSEGRQVRGGGAPRAYEDEEDSIVQWLRRSFLTGLFVTVPLVITVAAFIWIFGVIDGFTKELYARLLGREIPGLGILTMAVAVLAVGAVANNVIGRRLLERAESVLLAVPVFKTVYLPVKQLMAAFSPENEQGFKRVVMAEDPSRGLVLGFLTREFTVDRGRGPESMVAMYVPTNHLYLGFVRVYPRDRVSFPDLTVEEGIRVFLTGGMALEPHVRTGSAEEPAGGRRP
jgi:uncharacterized membrane protein